MADDEVQYLVETSGDGTFIIEIPQDWKVTFGYVNPAGSSDGYRKGQGHCLRVWAGKSSKTAPLRAVYSDVLQFRDLSIPLARKVEKQTGSAEWTYDGTGNFEHNIKVDVEHEMLSEGNGSFTFD